MKLHNITEIFKAENTEAAAKIKAIKMNVLKIFFIVGPVS
jgi:hypothetical protein